MTKKQVLEKLRAEIAKANAEYERLTLLCQHPYASEELVIVRREALAKAGGIAKCIEIVEAMYFPPPHDYLADLKG